MHGVIFPAYGCKNTNRLYPCSTYLSRDTFLDPPSILLRLPVADVPTLREVVVSTCENRAGQAMARNGCNIKATYILKSRPEKLHFMSSQRHAHKGGEGVFSL